MVAYPAFYEGLAGRAPSSLGGRTRGAAGLRRRAARVLAPAPARQALQAANPSRCPVAPDCPVALARLTSSSPCLPSPASTFHP